MTAKFPENFITLRWQRLPAALVSAELASLIALRKDDTADANLASRQQLLEIEQHLCKAHELYLKQQYQAAVDEYKLTQGILYQLLIASFPLAAARRPAIVFPLDRNLFFPLLTASLEFVEALAPRTIETSFGPVHVEVPENAHALAPYDDLGINLADDIIRSARHDSQLAAAYAERGQWERAEFFYKRAQQSLEAADTPDAQKAKASVALSLAGVLIQMDRAAEAQLLLNEASVAFSAVMDVVGQAQVALNMAAALAREEKYGQAGAQLTQADQLLKRAQGLPQDGVHPTGIGPGPTSIIPVTTIEPVILRAKLGSLLSVRPEFSPVVEGLISVARLGSTRPDTLQELPEAKGMAVTYRQPGNGGGWTTQPIETRVEASEKHFMKELGILVGENMLQVQWKAGDVVPADLVIKDIYERRMGSTKLTDINWRYDLPSDFAVQLPHLYFYVIPVALGDCFHALGEYDTAESYYLKAADYQYINTGIEIPALWQKLAENILEWGDRLYQNDAFQEALAIYRKVAEPPGAAAVVWAESPLYKHIKLKVVGDQVQEMLTTFETAGVGNMNPMLACFVLTIRGRLWQLNAGLDFLGMPTNIVPIWSFDYLQNAARYFAQQAIQAEREFINFWDHAENETLTRKQLEQAVTLAGAEQDLAKKQTEAAEAERNTYEGIALSEGSDGHGGLGQIFTATSARFQRWGVVVEDTIQIGTGEIGTNPIYRIQSVDSETRLTLQTQPPIGTNLRWSVNRQLATTRRLNSEENRTAYERMSNTQIAIDTDISWWTAPDYDIEGTDKRPYELVSDLTHRRGVNTRDYELGAMGRQTAELRQAEAMAVAQLDAADARVAAAKQMEEVARLRKQAADSNLAAFNNQFFTPEVWFRMGAFMEQISRHYLQMALSLARMMQRAYNFENDLDRHFIKTDYSTNTVKGMLAADALLQDIDSFTYDLITTVQRKQVPVKQTLSLAERYPFLFETQFRRTGRMEFETRLEDFDMAYPGTYARRIESIEVEIEGIVPSSGVRGMLTNGGISRYRTPDINQIKFRLQPRETLILSECRLKEDAIVFPADPKKLKIFEGAGVAGTWILEIPRSTNELDFRTITDVKMTFYYHARYDKNLDDAVRSQLATLAGVNSRSHSVPLRWAFPDAFFHFQDTGQLAFSLRESDFPFNQLNTQLRDIAVLVITDPGTNPLGWNIRLGVPAHPTTIAASPNAQGEISVVPGHPWQPLAAGAAVGDYLVEIRADENPGLLSADVLKLDKIQNMVLILEYGYTPRV